MSKYKIDMERIKKLEASDLTLPTTHKEIFNLIESLCQIIIEQDQEIQGLKDEINRLKGEKGKPGFKPKEAKDEVDKQKTDVAPKENWKKGTKKDKIKIDRIEIVEIDKTKLPEDAEFKGYEEKTVQNIIIKTDNVLYRMEKYYSAATGKTYIAELEESLQGTSYGPETKALISSLYYENRVTENKIASFLTSNGLQISEGTISNILINAESAELTKIKNEIYETGLMSSTYQQIDDTGINISGKRGYATIIGNEKYSAFFINASKSRETIMTFLTAWLASLFIVLVGDDAPQFKKITERYALCWIHEERHYKKLNPILEQHKYELECVRAEIWLFYDRLQDYKDDPTEEKKAELWEDFDELFGQKTGYEELDKRMTLTLEKKNELLTVLDYPEIPLHNNLSENGLRELVVKRKINGGVKSVEGLKAWENNLTILETCKKLGVSFYSCMVGVYSKKPSVILPVLISTTAS